MHYSATRGLAIACRLSVCLSVRLEILETNIAQTISPHFTLTIPKVIHLLPGEHGEIWWRLEMGWEK